MTCRPIKRTTSVRIVCEPRGLFSYSPYQWGSKEYWAWAERVAAEWCSEFHDFMRDHRSRDVVSMDVVRDTEEVCSECGHEWEVYRDDGPPICAYCGVEVATEEPAKEAK